MRLVLEQCQNAVYLTLSQAEVGTALYYAAFSGLTGRSFPGLFSSLTKPTRICLPLASWRNVLADLAANYSGWSAQLKGDDVITWVLGGQDYAADDELPGLGPISENLGQFELASDMLLLTDPYFNSCSVESSSFKAKRGTWNAVAEMTDGFTGMGVGRLTVYSDTLAAPGVFPDAFDAIISVESTLAGVFDETSVPPRDNDPSRTPFEQECWTATDSRGRPGTNARECPGSVLPHGVTVSAKNGDGRYGCYVLKDVDGMVVAVSIDFESNVGWPEEEE